MQENVIACRSQPPSNSPSTGIKETEFTVGFVFSLINLIFTKI